MSWTTRSPCAERRIRCRAEGSVDRPRQDRHGRDSGGNRRHGASRARARGLGDSTTCSWPTNGPSLGNRHERARVSARGHRRLPVASIRELPARQEWIQTGQIQLSQLISGQPAIGANGGQPAAVPLSVPGRYCGRLLCQRWVVVSARGDLWRAERCASTGPDHRRATVCWARRSRKNERSLSNDVPEGYLTVGSDPGPWQIRGICS